MRYSLKFTVITTISITNTECSFKVKTKQYRTIQFTWLHKKTRKFYIHFCNTLSSFKQLYEFLTVFAREINKSVFLFIPIPFAYT